MRARLHDLQVDSAGELDTSRPEPSEPDPLDEDLRAEKLAGEAPATPSESTDKPKASRLEALKSKLDGIRGRKTPAPRTDEPPPSTDGESQAALFGDEIWQQIERRELVKLDPTVGRVVLRQQAAAMHNFNYAFDFRQQAWNPK